MQAFLKKNVVYFYFFYFYFYLHSKNLHNYFIFRIFAQKQNFMIKVIFMLFFMVFLDFRSEINLIDPSKKQECGKKSQLVLAQEMGIAPSRIILDKNKSIKTLFLDRMSWASLPDHFICFSNLKEIHLNGNKLVDFPEVLLSLGSLQEIWMNNNQLIRLPENIQQIDQLQILSLNNTRLQKIPENICKITNLKRLFLQRNYLNKVPTCLVEKTPLQELNIAGNPLKSSMLKKFKTTNRLQVSLK